VGWCLEENERTVKKGIFFRGYDILTESIDHSGVTLTQSRYG
jgi:hypothetical protein